jgi:hypothetical protein
MTQDAEAPVRCASFDLEHLALLEPRESWVRQVKGDGDAWNAVRREPLIRQPVVRAEPESPRREFVVQLLELRLEEAPLDRQLEVAKTQIEQFLVRPGGPLRPKA